MASSKAVAEFEPKGIMTRMSVLLQLKRDLLEVSKYTLRRRDIGSSQHPLVETRSTRNLVAIGY